MARRKYNKPKKNYFFLLLSGFERWYYKLPFAPRHLVGILLVAAVLAGTYGIGYGGYCAARNGYHWIERIWQGTWHLDDHGTEYSVRGSHFGFTLAESEKHPKRRPNYHKDFDYLNDVQLKAAKRLGIKPQQTREDLERLKDKELVILRDTKYYQILELTSSSPYLVPRAADFLTALGRLMQEYNGTTSRYYISSVLRTQEDVRSLSRVNVNASKNSTHCYGTTFDITYSRFDVHGNTNEALLKEDLARALYDLQSKGYCYVKYEVKQPCFHVTVRP